MDNNPQNLKTPQSSLVAVAALLAAVLLIAVAAVIYTTAKSGDRTGNGTTTPAVSNPVETDQATVTELAESPPEKASDTPLVPPNKSGVPAILVEYTTYGGMCPYGGCHSKATIYDNGLIKNEAPAYNGTDYISTSTTRQIGLAQLNDLITQINNEDLDKVKQRKFTGTCPTAYDGSAATYTIYKNGATEILDSCQYILDQPLFKTIDQI